MKWNGDWFSMRGRFERIDYMINILIMIVLFIICIPIIFNVFTMAVNIFISDSINNLYYSHIFYVTLFPLAIYYQMLEIRAYRKARYLVRCDHGK